jgi:DNA-directed RNA polymerase specialized sigma24 family protein
MHAIRRHRSGKVVAQARKLWRPPRAFLRWRTCPDGQTVFRLALVSLTTDQRLKEIVRRQAGLVARLGGLVAERLESEVVTAFAKDVGVANVRPMEVRGFARNTAIRVAGPEIVYKQAAIAASCDGSANRAGLRPEDVAAEACERFCKQPEGKFHSVRGLKGWADEVASNYIIDEARRRKTREDCAERDPDAIGGRAHGSMPPDGPRVLADLRDFPRTAARIAELLGEPEDITRRLFELMVDGTLSDSHEASSKELAAMLDSTEAYVNKVRVKLRRKLAKLRRDKVIDWDVPDERAKAGPRSNP